MTAASEYGSPSERFTAVQLIITLWVSFLFAIVTTMPKPNFKDCIDRTFSTLNIMLSPATCSSLQEKCSLPGDTLDKQADEGYVVSLADSPGAVGKEYTSRCKWRCPFCVFAFRPAKDESSLCFFSLETTYSSPSFKLSQTPSHATSSSSSK